jgi:hydroxymethylglutaryl-CoA lyase
LGLANLVTALDLGIRHFDSALGGIGGCPFIKGATGNIATEDTASMLENMGYSTQIEINGVAKMSRWLEKKIDKNYFSGKLYKLTA